MFPADRIDPRSTKKARKKEELKNKLEKETFLNGTITEKKSELESLLKFHTLLFFERLGNYFMHKHFLLSKPITYAVVLINVICEQFIVNEIEFLKTK